MLKKLKIHCIVFRTEQDNLFFLLKDIQIRLPSKLYYQLYVVFMLLILFYGHVL